MEHILRVALHRLLKDIVAVHHITPRIEGKVVLFDLLPVLTTKLNAALHAGGVPLRLEHVEFDKVRLNVIGTITLAADRLRIHAVPCVHKPLLVGDTEIIGHGRPAAPRATKLAEEPVDKSAHSALRILSSLVSALSASSCVEIAEIDFHVSAYQASAGVNVCPLSCAPCLRLHIVQFCAAMEAPVPNHPQFVISCRSIAVFFDPVCSAGREVEPILQIAPAAAAAESAAGEDCAFSLTIAMPLVTKASKEGNGGAGISVSLKLGVITVALTTFHVESSIKTAREWEAFVPVKEAFFPEKDAGASIASPKLPESLPEHAAAPARGGVGLLDRWFESAAKLFGGEESTLSIDPSRQTQDPSSLDELFGDAEPVGEQRPLWNAGEELLHDPELLSAQISASVREIQFNLSFPSMPLLYALKIFRVTYANLGSPAINTLQCIHAELHAKLHSRVARLLSLTDIAVAIDASVSQPTTTVSTQSIDISADISDIQQGLAVFNIVQGWRLIFPQSSARGDTPAASAHTRLKLFTAALGMHLTREAEALHLLVSSLSVDLQPGMHSVSAVVDRAALSLNEHQVATLSKAMKAACLKAEFNFARRAMFMDADSFRISMDSAMLSSLSVFMAAVTDVIPNDRVQQLAPQAPEFSWRISLAASAVQFAQDVLLLIHALEARNDGASLLMEAGKVDVFKAAHSILALSATPGCACAIKVVVRPVESGCSSVDVDLSRLVLQPQVAHVAALHKVLGDLVAAASGTTSTTGQEAGFLSGKPIADDEHRIGARLHQAELSLLFAPECATAFRVADASIAILCRAGLTSIQSKIGAVKLELSEGHGLQCTLAEVSAVQAEHLMFVDQQHLRLLLPRVVLCVPLWNVGKLHELQSYLNTEAGELTTFLATINPESTSLASQAEAQFVQEMRFTSEKLELLPHIEHQAPVGYPVSLSLDRSRLQGPSMHFVLAVETVTIAVELIKRLHRDLTVDLDSIGMAFDTHSLPHQLQRVTPTTWTPLSSTVLQIESCIVSEHVLNNDPSSCILLRSERSLSHKDVSIHYCPFLYVSIMSVLPPRFSATAVLTEAALEWFLHTSTSDVNIILRGRLLTAVSEWASKTMPFKQSPVPRVGAISEVQPPRYFREVRLSSFRVSLDFDPEGFTATGAIQGVLPIDASISLVTVRGLSLSLPTVFLQGTTSNLVAAAAVTQLVDHFARNQLSDFVARVPAAALPKLRDLATQAYGSISLLSSRFHVVAQRILGATNVPTREMTLGLVESGVDALASMSATISQFARQAAATGISEVEARSGELSLVAWISLAGLLTWLQQVFRAVVERTESADHAAPQQPAPQFGRIADEWVML